MWCDVGIFLVELCTSCQEAVAIWYSHPVRLTARHVPPSNTSTAFTNLLGHHTIRYRIHNDRDRCNKAFKRFLKMSPLTYPLTTEFFLFSKGSITGAIWFSVGNRLTNTLQMHMLQINTGLTYDTKHHCLLGQVNANNAWIHYILISQWYINIILIGLEGDTTYISQKLKGYWYCVSPVLYNQSIV